MHKHRSFCFGAGDEARTRYLHLGKVALYRMSYTREDWSYYSNFFRFVNPLSEKFDILIANRKQAARRVTSPRKIMV